MNKEHLKLEYDKLNANYLQLEKEAKFILNREIAKQQIKTHIISSRIKKFDSFIRKVINRSITEPFEEVEDLLGLRIVCLFRSDIEKIGHIINDSFTIIREDNKIEGYEISSFGYLSVHFIVKIKDEYMGPRYDDIKEIKFEIQVRTLAMDAWATISHYLDYNNPMDVPKNLRKDFFALSGLFYVADTHFEMFYNESIKSRENITYLIEKEYPELNQEINMDSLKAYLLTKYPERTHSETNYISELVYDLKKAGYSTIREIDNIINKGMKPFNQYENDLHRNTYYTDVGAIRGSLYIVDDNFLKLTGSHNKKTLKMLLKYRPAK